MCGGVLFNTVAATKHPPFGTEVRLANRKSDLQAFRKLFYEGIRTCCDCFYGSRLMFWRTTPKYFLDLSV
jgi:hypothetical protein